MLRALLLFEPEILNFAGDRVAPDTESRGGIDTPPMRVFQRGANHRRFELAHQRVHHVGRAGFQSPLDFDGQLRQPVLVRPRRYEEQSPSAVRR